ncbi:hypothetical protein DACRYDRAFT_73851 [Dacryopinax primogenitus]|uniref:WD40 repeat-like protein n=1 Tax=Dacryopinax primogenitus (strain DJM 731) TaxID=1858805 RepID=M5GCT1_DACPD|nr:uncharacterized protein DACRYDRAFT_73851 [Dacryopinax primogenitus]EJU06405.1 hypothetical protein DACRYDRAFT_73851 [Dacryopinax primogenitus]
MHLARHTITPTQQTVIVNAGFDQDAHIFTTITPQGYAVYLTNPLRLITHRDIPNGTLAHVVPLHSTNLLFLVGGGNVPLYPPNKVILYNAEQGVDVAELEFREAVRGLACRRGMIAVALRRRVCVFEVGREIATVSKLGEWETCDNDRGLLAFASAPRATLLAFPGKQVGHVQFLHLPPCPGPAKEQGKTARRHSVSKPPKRTLKTPKNPIAIIAAHSNALTSLACPPSGSLLATSSERGTLVRVWDALTGTCIRELRRGADKAEIYGTAFRKDERELAVWSDKGTIHVFSLGLDGETHNVNQRSALAPLSAVLPLPKYFQSEWSYATFRLPQPATHTDLGTLTLPDEPELRCTCAWVEVPAMDERGRPREDQVDHNLVALTWAGGWYRLGLPERPTESVKGKEREGEGVSRQLVLEEFRRYSRWDGWG